MLRLHQKTLALVFFLAVFVSVRFFENLLIGDADVTEGKSSKPTDHHEDLIISPHHLFTSEHILSTYRGTPKIL